MTRIPPPLALLVVFALALALTGALSPAAGAAADDAAREFAFERLNRSYTLDDAELAPVRQGPIEIQLTVPDHVLVVRRHRLRLTPLGDGTYRAAVDATILGRGDLVADLDAGAGATRMTDRVVLPTQALEVVGRIAFARIEDGWDVTAHELPASVAVDIQSQLGLQIVTVCDQVAIFLGLDCSGLDRAFTRVDVPLPPAGSVFFLPAAELTQDEIEQLDRFLGLN